MAVMRRYFRRNLFRVFVGDDPVPGVCRVYRDTAGLKVTRLMRTDADDMTSVFGTSGVLTVVAITKDDFAARAFRIEYDGAVWDPLHLCSYRDQNAQEAMILTPTGEWMTADLDETHEWMKAYHDAELEAPPPSKLVKAAPKKKKTSRKKK